MKKYLKISKKIILNQKSRLKNALKRINKVRYQKIANYYPAKQSLNNYQVNNSLIKKNIINAIIVWNHFKIIHKINKIKIFKA